MAKSSKNNTPNEKSTIKEFETYRNLFTLRQRPVSLAFIEKLALELIIWARDDENALKITQFYRLKGINTNDMKRWEKRCDKLKAAHDFALTAIGDRREIGAIRNKFNASVIMSQMAKYDPTWWSLEVNRAELKARTQHRNDGDTKYTIVLESYKDEDKKKTDNMPEEK